MTGQARLDSYAEAGVLASIDLVNELTPHGRNDQPLHPAEALLAITHILSVDAPSLAALTPGDTPGFIRLAGLLRDVFDALQGDDVDAAAERLNQMLANHPAQPHLAKEQGRWRLHHHPVDAALVPMWTSICVEALARMIGAGFAERLGTCDDLECGRVFFDLSKNASRRFCSTTCQNRVKAAAFRRRQVADRLINPLCPTHCAQPTVPQPTVPQPTVPQPTVTVTVAVTHSGLLPRAGRVQTL